MKQKIFALLLAIVVSIGMTQAEIYSGTCGEEGSDLSWSLNTEDSVLTITGSGWMESHTWTYYSKFIKYVSLPAGLESITHSAFSGCGNLVSVTIPDNVRYIGQQAFFECHSLQSVTFGNGEHLSVDESAFSFCTSLKNVVMPNTNIWFGEYVFVYCNALPVIDGIQYADKYLVGVDDESLSSYTIREGTCWIGSRAFSNCTNLTAITIPETVKSIGKSAFYGTENLSSIVIPDNVTYIGDNAFQSSSISSVTFGSGLEEIGKYAFDYCSSLTSITIPENVKYVRENAFRGCESLTSITWNARRIYDTSSWFSYSPFGNIASQITSVTFGEQVEMIPPRMCPYMSNLTEVVIPSSVSEINSEAFYACKNLTSVTIGAGVTTINKTAFSNCTSLTNIQWNAANCVFDNDNLNTNPFYSLKSQIRSFRFGESVEYIPQNLCYEMVNVNSVELPAGLQYVGENAFYGCTGLDNITLHATEPPLTEVNSFYSTNDCPIYVPCGSLESYKSADQWAEVSDRLANVPSPYSLTATANIETAGTVDVEWDRTICNNTATLTALPANGYTFVQWSDGETVNPRTIEVQQDVELMAEFIIANTGTCGDNNALTWSYNAKDKTLTISGSGTLNSNFTYGAQAPAEMQHLVVTDGVTAIGVEAFSGIESLQTIELSADVQRVNERAFFNCINLSEIYLYRERPSVAYSNTFDGVDKFSCVLYVPTGSINMYQAATGWKDFFDIREMGHIVKFLDWDGSVLSLQNINDGESATAPEENPVREGYIFVGWDGDFSNVTSDMNITAVYCSTAPQNIQW